MCAHILTYDQTQSKICQASHWAYSYDFIWVKVQILQSFIIKQGAYVKAIQSLARTSNSLPL